MGIVRVHALLALRSRRNFTIGWWIDGRLPQTRELRLQPRSLPALRPLADTGLGQPPETLAANLTDNGRSDLYEAYS
jgi:hypothetical protein